MAKMKLLRLDEYQRLAIKADQTPSKPLALARLQAAIAREVGISVGPLVCHATMAMLEDHQLDSSAPWKRTDVSDLIDTCKAIRDEHTEAAA